MSKDSALRIVGISLGTVLRDTVRYENATPDEMADALYEYADAIQGAETLKEYDETRQTVLSNVE